MLNTINLKKIIYYYNDKGSESNEKYILSLLEDQGDCSLINDIYDDEFWNILHFASSYNHIEVVKYLLENTEIDVNFQTYDGYTPLYLAYYKGNKEIIELLENNPKIDKNIIDSEGLTFIEIKTFNEINKKISYFALYGFLLIIMIMISLIIDKNLSIF